MYHWELALGFGNGTYDGTDSKCSELRSVSYFGFHECALDNRELYRANNYCLRHDLDRPCRPPSQLGEGQFARRFRPVNVPLTVLPATG